MSNELAQKQEMNHNSCLVPKQDKLLVIVTNNNRNAKELLRQWASDKPKTRNLKEYNPIRLNTSTLMLDDTEYTRDCCKWIKTLYPKDILVLEYKHLF